jgi:hypothetical protein
MKKTNVVIGFLFFGIFSLVLINCNNENKNVYSNQDQTLASLCLAPATWFPHSQTPAPNEGNSSPFSDPKTTSNCDFHQWAWQKFLYLTHPVSENNKVLNFLNYKQVDNQMNLLGNTIILDDTTQAGSHSALYDKKAKSIYYAIFMNDEMYQYTKKYTDLFVFNCQASDSSINQNQLHMHGYDTINYPVGSVEVKTSWILASSLDSSDLSNYYITKGILKNTKKMVDIALIGMHVVGRVENHPEFIWATFEHNHLAPYAQWPANFQNDSTPDPKQVLSTENSLFYKAGLILDSCSVRPYSASHPNPPVNKFRSTYHLYQNGMQPQYTNMILRNHDSINQINTQSINQSVLSQLSKETGPWKNYEYIGSVWIDPTVAKLQPGNSNIGGLNATNLRGSRANTNITMETFAQLDWSYPASGAIDNGNTNPCNSMNCFGCHATANFQINGNTGANYNMALSHLFNNRLRMLLKKNGESGALYLNHKKK